MCARIKFCNHQRPGRAKLLKSLYPTVHVLVLRSYYFITVLYLRICMIGWLLSCVNTTNCWKEYVALSGPPGAIGHLGTFFQFLKCGNRHSCMLAQEKINTKAHSKTSFIDFFLIVENGSWVVTLMKACRAIGETILLYSRYNNSVLCTKFRCLKVHNNENFFLAPILNFVLFHC